MATTSLFIELLIIGFEVLFGLVLLFSWVTGSTYWLTTLAGGFKDYSLLGTALVFAIAYLLGIIFDKSAKWLIEESLPGKRLQEVINQEKLGFDDFQRMYAKVVVQKGEPMSDLLYARSKVRILRASIISVPLITISGILFLLRTPSHRLWWLPVIIGGFSTVLARWGYIYNHRLYRHRLELFFAQLPERDHE